MVPQVLGLGLACTCQEGDYCDLAQSGFWWIALPSEIPQDEQCWGHLLSVSLTERNRSLFLYLHHSFLCAYFTFGELFSLKREIIFISIFVQAKALIIQNSQCKSPDYTNTTGKE